MAKIRHKMKYDRGMTMVARISMWEAYLIETIQNKGMDKTTLLNHLQNAQAAKLNDFDSTFDYGDLLEAYQADEKRISEAIKEDYQVKFITQPGIKRLMHIKFDLEEGKDYQTEEGLFSNIPFTQEQLTTFKTMLSANWLIKETSQDSDGKTIVNIGLASKMA